MTGGVENDSANAEAVQNFILTHGADSDAWRHLFETEVLPCIVGFDPDLLIISAGFDAHSADPLSNCELGADDFEWVTEELLKCCGGRAVSILEGGYDIPSLCESAVRHVSALVASRK